MSKCICPAASQAEAWSLYGLIRKHRSKEEPAPQPPDPRARLAEIRSMLEEQEKSSVSLRQKLDEFEKLL